MTVTTIVSLTKSLKSSHFHLINQDVIIPCGHLPSKFSNVNFNRNDKGAEKIITRCWHTFDFFIGNERVNNCLK